MTKTSILNTVSRSRGWLFVLTSSFITLGALTGCEGNVVTQEGGGGTGAHAADGGGGAHSGGTTTDTGTESGSTATSTSPGTVCQALCEAGLAAMCIMGSIDECVAGCESNYTQYPDCSNEITAAYQCATDKVGTEGCDIAQICPAEYQAMFLCVGGSNPCSGMECSGSSDGCSCTGTCGGKTLEATCTNGPSGSDCTCIADGVEVGTCTEPDATCDPVDGCCGAIFFPDQ